MYENRMKSMEQIEEMLTQVFQQKEELSFDEFSHITSNESSDLVIFVL